MEADSRNASMRDCTFHAISVLYSEPRWSERRMNATPVPASILGRRALVAAQSRRLQCPSEVPEGLSQRMRSRRERREMHGLNADGMLLCNPRDREAAHRAQVAGIATESLSSVTCSKCRTLMHRSRHEARGREG